MKKLFFILLLSLSVSVSFAQEDLKFSSGRDKHDGKPQLFTNLSPKFSVRAGLIDEIMSSRLNQPVSLLITEGFVFNGKILSKTSDAPGLETVTIESNEKQGLLFTLSKTTIPGEGIVYRGLLISRNHSDMVVLEKDPITGVYEWTKKPVSQMISD